MAARRAEVHLRVAQGELLLRGTKVYPSSCKFINLQREKGKVRVDDEYEQVLVFAEASWTGSAPGAVKVPRETGSPPSAVLTKPPPAKFLSNSSAKKGECHPSGRKLPAGYAISRMHPYASLCVFSALPQSKLACCFRWAQQRQARRVRP